MRDLDDVVVVPLVGQVEQEMLVLVVGCLLRKQHLRAVQHEPEVRQIGLDALVQVARELGHVALVELRPFAGQAHVLEQVDLGVVAQAEVLQRTGDFGKAAWLIRLDHINS